VDGFLLFFSLAEVLALQFPSALPQMFASFKVAWTLAVIGAVVGEVFGAYKVWVF